jgi:hypothetical membrane protein
MEKKLFNLSLILAPLFYTLSGFFWLANGRYNVAGGTLIIIGSIFWIVVFNGLFDVLKVKTPVYSTIGRFLAIYGCVCGGVAFGLQDAFAHIFGISHKTMLDGLGAHPIFANLIFWRGGPLFPLNVFVLGIVLVRTKTIALWAGVLFSLGGILFHISRILRIEAMAHAVDVLMLIPMFYIALCGVLNSNKTEINYN